MVGAITAPTAGFFLGTRRIATLFLLQRVMTLLAEMGPILITFHPVYALYQCLEDAGRIIPIAAVTADQQPSRQGGVAVAAIMAVVAVVRARFLTIF
jgi:hypothetical protein